MTTDTEVQACGVCGSTTLHHIAFGYPSPDLRDDAARRSDLRLGGCCVDESSWSIECQTCGQRNRFGNDRSRWTTGSRPDTAGLVTRYAAAARAALGTSTAPALSYAGLWLLLARFAPITAGARRAALAEAIGTDCDHAAALAAELLATPHPTIAAALGAWSRVAVAAGFPVPLDDLPAQEGLDRWAFEHTRGLIRRFPVSVNPETLMVLATALVLEPRWTNGLETDDNGMLVLEDGLQTVVRTDAAGLVAVAKPFSTDGIDVVSVIAAQEFSPEDVWRAVDEVVTKLNAGELWHGEAPNSEPGHAWTVRTVTEQFLRRGAPEYRDILWRSHLPSWSAEARSTLTAAPGVGELAAALSEALARPGGPAECVQAASAAYDENGFAAAAVTTMAFPTGVPELVERTVRRVEVTFDRPHAVVALARGGAWEGVPIFHCWVKTD